MNGYTPVRILLNALLFVSIITAREVTLTGTVMDTVLVPGTGGQNATLSVMPASGLKVTVTAGCNRENADSYFTFTNSSGIFRTVATLPDTCLHKSYIFSAAAILPDSSKMSSFFSINTDSVSGEIAVRHFTFDQGQHRDSIVDNEGTHEFGLYQPSRYYTAGDSVSQFYVLWKTDSIQNNSRCNLLLTTSECDTVLDTFFTGNNPAYFPSGKVWHRNMNCSFRLPKALEKEFTAFAQDRQLHLSLSLSGTDIEFKQTLIVLPQDISSLLPTKTVYDHQPELNTVSSGITLNRQGPLLMFTTPAPGNYTIDLFLPNGRLISRLLDNVHLPAGHHTFPLHPDNRRRAQTTFIARVAGSEGMVETLKLLW